MHDYNFITERSETGLSMIVKNSLSKYVSKSKIYLNNIVNTPQKIPLVVVASNEEKYASVNLPYATSADLSEVFELMRSLNYQGITNPDVGCHGGGDENFTAVLNKTCDILAERYQGQEIRYIELGPEPIKTELMVSGLLARGVALKTYMSVDINPESAAPMRQVIKRVRSSINIDHILCNFDELTRDKLVGDQPAIFTSLGFQEGNHLPNNVRAMLTKILDKNDTYMCEMQVRNEINEAALLNFYELPQMRAFSKNCVRRAFGNIESTYGIQLLDAPEIGKGIKVATTTETFHDDHGQKIHYVTNYCLKPTVKQLKGLREETGDVKVFETLLTSDKSMLLQLSEKKTPQAIC